MIDKLYYHCRDGDLYTNYTKEEIDDLIDLDDFSTWFPFLKDMDYPAALSIYETRKDFHKYIVTMKLAGYRNLGWSDSFPVYHTTTSKTAFIELDKAMSPDKIILTKRLDGDWDCIIEQIAYSEGRFIPIRVSGVIDDSNVPALLEFKLNNGCLYKIEVTDKDDT